MKNFLLITLIIVLSVFFYFITNGQDSNYNAANSSLIKKGEVYFRFQIKDKTDFLSNAHNQLIDTNNVVETQL